MAQTITYNEDIPLTHIYSTTSGGTVYGSNLCNAAAFNYFANNAVVNDALYFGFYPSLKFGSLTFNVGTALAGTGIAITWEYWNGTAWAALAWTDNTAGFTATGVRTLVFTPPSDWVNRSVNGVDSSSMWIRARISALTSITNGGANTTSTVKCKNLAITIANPGAMTTSFCNALYNASVAGGWGVVTKNNNQYYFACHLFLGYSTDSDITTLTDSSVAIEIEGLVFARKSNSKLVLGELISDTDKTSKNGVFYSCNRKLHRYFADSDQSVKWYCFSCLMNCSPYVFVKAYNTIVNGAAFIDACDANNGPQLSNVMFQTFRPDFITTSLFPNTYINKIQVSGASQGVRLEYAAIVRGLIIIGALYLGDAQMDANSSYDITLIDPVSNAWGIYWYNVPSGRGHAVFRCHSLNASVADSAGNAVQNVSMAILDANKDNNTWIVNGRSTNTLLSAGTVLSVDTNNWSIGDFVKIAGEILLITGGAYPNYTVARAQKNTYSGSQKNPQPIYRLNKNILSNSSGIFSEVIIGTHVYTWASGSGPGVTSTASKNPFTVSIRKYGYIFSSPVQTIQAAASLSIVLDTNTFVSAVEGVAASYTGIAIDGINKTITISTSHAMQEVYDYCEWWACQSGNLTFDEPVSTNDGVNFKLALNWSMIIDGVSVTASGKRLSTTGTGTYSLINGADFTGTLATPSQTRVLISVANIVAGSRIQLYDVTASVELLNTIVPGTSRNLYFTHTGTDHAIRLRLMYVNGTLAKKWHTQTGMVTNTGLSFNAAQADDPVYNSVNIDGSTVTECSISGSTIRIYINDPDNTTQAQRIYNWYMYYLSTQAGIANQDGAYITAVDNTHYVFDNSMKIVNQNTGVPLEITGANITPVSGNAGNIFDVANGASIVLNFNRVEGFGYSAGSGLSVDEHDFIYNKVATKNDLIAMS